MPLTEVHAQLLVSNTSNGEDKVYMYHVYAACLPFCARDSESLGCALLRPGFLQLQSDAKMKIMGGTVKQTREGAGGKPEQIFPGPLRLVNRSLITFGISLVVLCCWCQESLCPCARFASSLTTADHRLLFVVPRYRPTNWS